MLKLCSIFNIWSDALELIPKVIENHSKFSDGIIIVWSSLSNHGNDDDGRMMEFILTHDYTNVLYHQLEPHRGYTPLANETRKRNQGIELAKKEGYTHFLIADIDEFYHPEEIDKDKLLFDNPEINGLVYSLRVYVGKPILWCEDHTLVLGLQKLRKDTYVGNFAEMPFAYDAAGQAHIDPSRRVNERFGIIKSDTICHHLSYVRKNIDLKIANSSANLRRSEAAIKRDIANAAPGYISELYHRELKEAPNYFNI